MHATAIGRCRACDLVSLAPQPADAERRALYHDEYYASDSPSGPGYWADDELDKALIRSAEMQLRVLDELGASQRRLLDIGCGPGAFLEVAARRGWQASGVELSPEAAAQAIARGLDVTTGEFPACLPAGPFDAITMWDVVEHLPRPVPALRSIRSLLAQDGRLVLSTPSVERWDARLFGRRWYGFSKVPEHLFFYSPASLIRDLREAGFGQVSIRRWGLVRSVAYLLANLGLGGWPSKLAGRTAIGRRLINWPMIEMLAIARPA